MVGVVKTFSNGVGFIHSFQDQYYFKSTGLMVPVDSIGPGVKVFFDTKETPYGPEAIRIKPRKKGIGSRG